MKTRISLTIEEKLIKNIDKTIDGINIRSRSNAIEKILENYISHEKTAVILCGGKPEDLFIKELKTYRPLVDIGKRKLIEDVVLKCRQAGFYKIIIIGSSKLISKLYEVLGNGEKYEVNITYVEEKKHLGSAKTLELAKRYVRTDFLFLPCDFYFDFDIGKILEFHKLHNGTATIGIHTRTNYKWDKAIVDLDGYKIINYEENPKNPSTTLVGVFLGFMNLEIFNKIPPGDVQWTLQDNIFPKLAKEGKLLGYPIAGDWVNIHTKEDVDNVIDMNKSN